MTIIQWHTHRQTDRDTHTDTDAHTHLQSLQNFGLRDNLEGSVIKAHLTKELLFPSFLKKIMQKHYFAKGTKD